MADPAKSSIFRPLEGVRTALQSQLCSAVDAVVGVAVDPSRTLVINGFWRSGTTWVQEIATEMMGAKMVFEPFQARAKAIFECLDEIRPQRRDYAFVNGLMPYAQSLPGKGELHGLIRESLRGQFRPHHVRRGEPRLQDSMRKRVVVKFTRATLCLVAISRCFQAPVIHVWRDPRAVIASIKKGWHAEWGEGAFSDFDLATHLLGVDDGRRDYFLRWEKEIQELQRQDDFARLAGYYCLTEKCLVDQVALANPSRFVRARYEDLLIDGLEKFRALLESLGVPTIPIAPERFNRQSSTSFSKSADSGGVAKPERRAPKWKELLTPAEQKSIEDVVVSFGMEDRLYGQG